MPRGTPRRRSSKATRRGRGHDRPAPGRLPAAPRSTGDRTGQGPQMPRRRAFGAGRRSRATRLCGRGAARGRTPEHPGLPRRMPSQSVSRRRSPYFRPAGSRRVPPRHPIQRCRRRRAAPSTFPESGAGRLPACPGACRRRASRAGRLLSAARPTGTRAPFRRATRTAPRVPGRSGGVAGRAGTSGSRSAGAAPRPGQRGRRA